MNTRGHMTPYLNNSLAVRQEIQRFESVHPSIYAIYDLIEAIQDPLIQQQVREHVVCIEDSFVNSQEWTLSRSVPDLKLGILGTINSGKSALVHRYLTGSYMQEESPEGGRFKKEVVLDGQSYLLLIRDEGGPPEMQFTHWVDAIIFVFSLENELSFNAIYTYYAKMGHFRNVAEIPIILVGTQDAISESNPRVIDDTRARKLASDLRRCSYYETCATYGLNVERVFQDACQKIVSLKCLNITPNNSRPNTPNQALRGYYTHQQQQLPSSKSYEAQVAVGGPGGGQAGGSGGSGGSAGTMTTHTPPSSTHSIHGPSPTSGKEAAHKHGDKKHKHSVKETSSIFRERDRERPPDHERLRASDPPLSYAGGGAQQGGHMFTHAHSHGGSAGGGFAVPIPVAPPTVPPPPTHPPEDVFSHHELTQQLQQVQQQLSAEDLRRRYQGQRTMSLMLEHNNKSSDLHHNNNNNHHLHHHHMHSNAPSHNHSNSRESVTPGSTPVPPRKNKKGQAVQKSNSFSGSALIQRATEGNDSVTSPHGGTTGSTSSMGKSRTPSSTPQLGRKSKTSKSFSFRRTSTENSPIKQPQLLEVNPYDSSAYSSDQLTPLLGRREHRYRFSLIVEKMDTFIKDLTPGGRDPGPLTPLLSRIPRVRSSLVLDKPPGDGVVVTGSNESPTPSGTPTQKRKDRRRSNLFSKKGEDDKNKVQNGQLGSGRSIPLKQGYLYKKSNKPLNKDWKKKYVSLTNDGRLCYHPNLHDYMDDSHGKELQLRHTTVKVPGQRPRGTRTQSDNQANGKAGGPPVKENVLISAFDDAVIIPNSSINPALDVFMTGTPVSKMETPNVKKRHKRAKSGAKNLDNGQGDDGDVFEFHIVSLDNKQWHFEAVSSEERDDWVTAIEQQILSSLQSNESNKSKQSRCDPNATNIIRQVKGNQSCADCDSQNPEWASLNLGALICIECSGIHRNLGTHLSRVRSLELDEWPPELVAVMTNIGNTATNNIWEVNTKGHSKPTPNTSREEKEKWIRAKYDSKEFVPPPPYLDVPLPQQLIDAIARQDIHNTVIVLAYCKADHVNAPYSKTDTRTALHIAAALGNVVLVQLLLWQGANVRIVDHERRNALWYAQNSGSNECIELLRNNDCPESTATLPRQPRPTSQPGGIPGMDADKMQASVI